MLTSDGFSLEFSNFKPQFRRNNDENWIILLLLQQSEKILT